MPRSPSTSPRPSSVIWCRGSSLGASRSRTSFASSRVAQRVCPNRISFRNAGIARQPRQIGMYLAKHLTSRSLPEIGRRLGIATTPRCCTRSARSTGEVGENPRLKEEIEELKLAVASIGPTPGSSRIRHPGGLLGAERRRGRSGVYDGAAPALFFALAKALLRGFALANRRARVHLAWGTNPKKKRGFSRFGTRSVRANGGAAAVILGGKPARQTA